MSTPDETAPAPRPDGPPADVAHPATGAAPAPLPPAGVAGDLAPPAVGYGPPPGYAGPPPGYAGPPPGYAGPPASGYAAGAQPPYPVPPAYAAPPQYGAPQYGVPPQYGAPYGYPVKPPAGALAWGLGFLAYIPIPYIGIIIAGIVMACVYGSQSRKGPIAEANARNAANWGLTVALLTVVCFLIGLIAGAGLGNDGAWIAGLMAIIWIAACITHLVLIIRGLVRAGRGAVLTVPFAIPFIRA